MAASLGWPPPNAQSAQTIPQEYELKAVYLYNFLQFVNWPTGACATKSGRIEEIAVLGDSPISESLKNLKAELKRTRGFEISLRFYGRYEEGMDLSGCQLLFIAQPELRHLKKIIGSLKGKPALLVADDEDCLDQGCMISLLTQSNKVRWAINRRSAEASGLRMNARLLEMAMKVVE
ncbi:MAG: YfiR family protein [Desulfobulbaceae bacterium]|nr:YfiR family protein [Desulfobulbaceae bacterium]